MHRRSTRLLAAAAIATALTATAAPAQAAPVAEIEGSTSTGSAALDLAIMGSVFLPLWLICGPDGEPDPDRFFLCEL
ncbi:hypothetical protein AB0H58_29275 [Nocardia neocaledoniensis]|uniref:hypothetical protein n=1 Tax=Nocardia TaxID=1817 RepID=UPI001E3A2126|nr:hypothetical protein [Nocardia asteroides]UGT52398.1 hypothetical protein LTT85_16770 [Nocardia asteroides]